MRRISGCTFKHNTHAPQTPVTRRNALLFRLTTVHTKVPAKVICICSVFVDPQSRTRVIVSVRPHAKNVRTVVNRTRSRITSSLRRGLLCLLARYMLHSARQTRSRLVHSATTSSSAHQRLCMLDRVTLRKCSRRKRRPKGPTRFVSSGVMKLSGANLSYLAYPHVPMLGTLRTFSHRRGPRALAVRNYASCAASPSCPGPAMN